MTGPVSGPGPYSQRTDKQPVRDPGGLPYGDNQALRQQQQAAPMAATPQIPAQQPIALNAPTQRPDEPVTAGAARGPGPGPEAIAPRAAPVTGSPLVQALRQAAAGDPSGQLAMLLSEAMRRGL
jgi:hypothetical protein